MSAVVEAPLVTHFVLRFRPIAAALALLMLAGLMLPNTASAQRTDGPPNKPTLPLTTNRNPRGDDIVEPARAYKVTFRASGRADTTYLGIAKIPDPRLGQEGAYVVRDERTRTMVRFADAWIFDESGLRQGVPMDASALGEWLVILPGPYDEVTSRQGVVPVRSLIGDTVIFDLRALWEASVRNPLNGAVDNDTTDAPRIALLTMRSTYPRGEIANLAIPLAPVGRSDYYRLSAIRDSTILYARPNFTLINAPEIKGKGWTATVWAETGLGLSVVRTHIPAVLRSPFTNYGTANVFFLDGGVRLQSGDTRWVLQGYGNSSVTATQKVDKEHHQVAAYVDGIFEKGEERFLTVRASGQMTDKQYQEFDWANADYALMLMGGFGSRRVQSDGEEAHRLSVQLGVRMGENRKIEVFETRDRARGIGPVLVGGFGLRRELGITSFRTSGEALGYAIFGRGDRDAGFNEQGLRAELAADLGRRFFGIYVHAGGHAQAYAKQAKFQEGGKYWEVKAWVAPSVGMEITM